MIRLSERYIFRTIKLIMTLLQKEGFPEKKIKVENATTTKKTKRRCKSFCIGYVF